MTFIVSLATFSHHPLKKKMKTAPVKKPATKSVKKSVKKTFYVYDNKITVDLEEMMICLIRRERNLTADELLLYLYIQRGGKF